MIRQILFPPTAAALMGLLSACAAPDPVVQSSGTLPAEGGYGFGADGALSGPAAAVLTEKLAKQGLTQSDTPRYLVQAEYSRPPAKTGTVVADQTPAQWRRAPVRGGGEISRLSLSMTDITSGTEVYRSTAWQKKRGKADDSAALMQAALDPTRHPPAPPAE